MNDLQKKYLKERLPDPDLNFNQKITEFLKIFNSGSSDPGLRSEKWNISKSDWQRYEFLGDRVLNLVAADYLYHHLPLKREGEMTKMMGVVSNESLAGLIERNGFDVDQLIPSVIGRQQTYREKVKGGALEAFVGVLYENIGFEGTFTIILSILAEEIERYDLSTNYIGRLQESHQQRALQVLVYTEVTDKRYGPMHSPRFTYRVYTADGSCLGEGTGRNAAEAKQAAAKAALEKIES
jgi:ribonuclease-3